jgi:hypothetical protein
LFELQVVRELFCQLAANMWSIPQAVAERQALIKQRELQKKLYQLNSPGKVPVQAFKRGSGLRDITLPLFITGSVMIVVLNY